MKRSSCAATAGALAAAITAAPAAAGPPYVTDDPIPTELGRWEVYGFVSGAHTPGVTGGEGGLDINYGAAKDLQLTLVVPLAYEHADRMRAGFGVVEAAAKLQLLHQDGAGLDLTVFPRVFLPTARARFGPRNANLLLPLWAQKDFGPWSVFGGGGYQLNPGRSNRNFWTEGLAVTRAVGERLSLGAEVFHHSADAVDAHAFTGVNVGVTYRLTPQWSLLASGGPGVQNAAEEGRSQFYLALKADF